MYLNCVYHGWTFEWLLILRIAYSKRFKLDKRIALVWDFYDLDDTLWLARSFRPAIPGWYQDIRIPHSIHHILVRRRQDIHNSRVCNWYLFLWWLCFFLFGNCWKKNCRSNSRMRRWLWKSQSWKLKWIGLKLDLNTCIRLYSLILFIGFHHIEKIFFNIPVKY